uniref:D-aminoacyl-tRNA deacylase n=1 Tax=Arcella intermedia TaxID=1963864 RepID=A0A6B2LMN5_9EUKA
MARLVLQEIQSAKLLVDNKDEWVSVEAGLVVYICFLSNPIWTNEATTKETIKKMVSPIFQLSTQWREEEKKKRPIEEVGGDILIIPQASLGGKIKQKNLQFHGLIDKPRGLELYQQFIDECILLTKTLNIKSEVRHGTYGNRQGLHFVSNGPNTIALDF